MSAHCEHRVPPMPAGPIVAPWGSQEPARIVPCERCGAPIDRGAYSGVMADPTWLDALVGVEAARRAAEAERAAAREILRTLPAWLGWMGLRPRGLRLIYRLRLAERPVIRYTAAGARIVPSEEWRDVAR